MNSRYIQRGKFKETECKEITGLDSIMKEYDYMGSAEFEMGALPQSLKRIAEHKDKYIGYKTDIRTKKFWYKRENFKDKINPTKREIENLYVYCKEERLEEVLESVKYISKNKYGYKHYCDVVDYIQGIEGCSTFWWDIENDFMLYFGEANNEKIKKAIEKLNKKWFPRKITLKEKIINKIKGFRK